MPKKQQVYLVEGFAFTSEKEAEQAKKEVEGIKYVKAKTDMDNPEMVLQVYNKMVDEKMFVTAVGYAYLEDLQEYLRTIPFIKQHDIHPIQIVHPTLSESLKEQNQIHRAKMKEVKRSASKQIKELQESSVQRRYKMSLMVNMILLVSVIGMFILTATSSHPTIINYEEKLLNRYAAWEQELTEREAAVREAENR